MQFVVSFQQLIYLFVMQVYVCGVFTSCSVASKCKLRIRKTENASHVFIVFFSMSVPSSRSSGSLV